jgi:hypothetical protein
MDVIRNRPATFWETFMNLRIAIVNLILLALICVPLYALGQGKAATKLTPAEIQTLLSGEIDVKDFRNSMTLAEAIALLREKIAASKKKDLQIVVDNKSFKAENPDAPDVNETLLVSLRIWPNNKNDGADRPLSDGPKRGHQ